MKATLDRVARCAHAYWPCLRRHEPELVEAAEEVRQGIASYGAGDYQQAAAAFNEADVAQPDDLRIAFDRGMALAAQGDADKAVELLEKAALSPDLELAVRARYNLGCLAAAKARKQFGEHPEKASPEVRSSGLADLAGRSVISATAFTWTRTMPTPGTISN